MAQGVSIPRYDVAEQSDHVEVRGVSGDDVLEALRLLDSVRDVQAAQVADTRADLVRALMTSRISLTPPATLAQAQRLATHRDALLSTPVLTYSTLQQLRGDPKESSTRTWFARRRAQHAVFAVGHDGRTLIPAFQLDQFGQPRRELAPVLDVLLTAGIDGWPLWTWLTSPSGLLSGGTPESVATTASERALVAATRFAVPPAG